ncbi:hypothetical protein ANN_15962 [Periplaneta americana]|uniref:GST C-terminal domain-containing protein n=1 Tax=Periplaneta americana TaxID=6978 RepID=A0ABQ8SIV6_PERAM|nr:hypothetical protein ANN_15962 [Periplaneta americana]
MPRDLYYLPASAPCRSVLLTAKAVGVDLNVVHTDLFQGAHLQPDFLKPRHMFIPGGPVRQGRLSISQGSEETRPGKPEALLRHRDTVPEICGLLQEHRLRVFENKVLRKIFGAKRDEVTGEWRKLHNAELHALYSSPDIIRNIKSRRLRWAGHVARMGESRNAYRVLVGRPEGKRPLGRPRRRWEDNIKMDLREVGYDDRDWINLAQDRDRWRAYVRAAMNLRLGIMYMGQAPDPAKFSKLEEAFQLLDKFLEGQTWAAGDTLTIADIDLLTSVSSAETFDFDVSKYPNVAKWYSNAKKVIPGYEEINQTGCVEYRKLWDKFTSKKK